MRCLSTLIAPFLLLLVVLSARAQTTPDGFQYSVANGGVAITGYTGTASVITIPSSIAGLPVTTIGAGAFEFAYTVKTLTIPNSVISIGMDAFKNAFSLMAIEVAADNPSYSSLNGALFDKVQSTLIECPAGIKGTYTIPKSATSIGPDAFGGSLNLSAINVEAGNPVFVSVNGVVFSVSQTTLVQCPASINIQGGSYVVPQGVTSIGAYAFVSSYLSSVIIPNSVTSIGAYAFAGSQLGGITLPTSLTSIGAFAFSQIYSYAISSSVTIPASVSSIGVGAFAQNFHVSAINVAAGNPFYTSVDGILFNKNKSTLIQFPTYSSSSYVIPSSVTNIADYAFTQTALVNVTIPNSVTSIGASAFAVSDLSSVALPNSVTKIGTNAFSLTSLTSITIPAGVTSIGDSAFSDCALLSAAYFLGNAPTMGKSVFSGTFPGFSVYYTLNATGFSSPIWTDSSGDMYPASHPYLSFTAVVKPAQAFHISLSSYGISGPYQIQSMLPSWITFDSTTGNFIGTGPVASGRVVGSITLMAVSSGHPVEVAIEFVLVNALGGSQIFHLDVGDISQTGQANLSASDVLTVTGSGTGLGNGLGKDGYHYVYLSETGDFTIITQVISQLGGGESGIVVKDGLDEWSSFIAILLKAGVGTMAEYAIGSVPATALGTDTAMAKAPETIGLVRSGDTFIEYELLGTYWQQIGTVTIPFAPSTLYVGLADSSDNNSASTTATFSNVQVLPYAE